VSDPEADAELAAELATEAGRLLVELRAQTGFADPYALRKAGDRRSNELLIARLAQARPNDAVLSEESPDDRTRLDADRVWIIDPLDGTTEYGEEGRTDWAVHVALWERSGPADRFGLTAAAVALPGLDRTLSTGAPLPGRGVPAPSPRLAVSRTRRPSWFDRVAGAVGGEAYPLGSAGMKAMSVVLGITDAYVHSGRMKEWDSAAPVAVALSAGLHVSRIDGSPLTYNTAERLTLDLLICEPSLAVPLLAAADGIAGTDTATR
jgi:3'(2'), 5'-bisphosphate nucleotidase